MSNAGPTRDGHDVTIQDTVHTIWTRELKLEDFSDIDDFFELGGHSLIMTRIQRDLQSELGIEVPMDQLFRRSTVAAISEHITAALASPTGRAPIPSPPSQSSDAASSRGRRLSRLTGIRSRMEDIAMAARDPTHPEERARLERSLARVGTPVSAMLLSTSRPRPTRRGDSAGHLADTDVAGRASLPNDVLPAMPALTSVRACDRVDGRHRKLTMFRLRQPPESGINAAEAGPTVRTLP